MGFGRGVEREGDSGVVVECVPGVVCGLESFGAEELTQSVERAAHGGGVHGAGVDSETLT